MGHEVPLDSLPPDTPQAEIQRRLETVHGREGLPAAMAQLFDFEMAAGYLTRQKIEEVERLSFRDPDTEIDFRIQVNFARSRYQPAPSAASGTPGSPGEPPTCLLCKGNVGRPGNEALRVYEFDLDRPGRRFFLQLTPFPLFPYHFVLILREHRPQNIDRQTLPDMFAFLEQAPGYTVCSNSDVEWAGSSILDHLHFQVFRDLHLPVMDARGVAALRGARGGCRIEVLEYPMSAFRLASPEAAAVEEAGTRLIERWKNLEPGRNTVNLVLARARDAPRAGGTAGGDSAGRAGSRLEYRLTVLLRNPDYRTPPELRRFKSEGVGVIEASGEAILPVPRGEDAEQLWARIRRDGLEIVKGIIAGNSPAVAPARMAELIGALETGTA